MQENYGDLIFRKSSLVLQESISLKTIISRNLYVQLWMMRVVIPKNYFDIVYTIYAVGWAIDLKNVFHRIASYLKKEGTFIFSWKHPLHGCVIVEDGELIF